MDRYDSVNTRSFEIHLLFVVSKIAGARIDWVCVLVRIEDVALTCKGRWLGVRKYGLSRFHSGEDGPERLHENTVDEVGCTFWREEDGNGFGDESEGAFTRW